MTIYSDRLREMINDAPDESDNLANNISQITDIRDDVQDQIDAVQTGMLDVAEADLIDYLENTKVAEVGGASVTYGPNFSLVDYTDGGISDWTIDSTAGVPIYAYEGVGWDSDATIIKLIDDYDFGNDYLTRPLTSGATYGLIPYKTNLNSAISILTENKDKVDDSITYLEDYAT